MDRPAASDSARHGPRGGRARLTAGIAAAFTAISLLGIPAAIAKSAHERTTASTPSAATPAPPGVQLVAPVSESPSPKQQRLEEAAKRREEEAAKRNEEREQRRHEIEQRHGELEKARSEAEQQRAAANQQRREVVKQRVEGGQVRAQVRAQSHEATRRLQTTANRLQVKAQRQAAKGAAGGKGGKSGEPAPPARGSNATAPPVSPAGPVAAVAASAPAANAPAVTPSPSPPTLTAPRRSTGAGHARVSRHHHRASHAAAATRSAAAAAPLLLAGAGTQGTPAPAARSGSGAARTSKPEHAVAPSPIVNTITRIVGVVPNAVWALVAALVALALGLAVRTRLSARRARRLESQRSQLLEDVGLLQAALLPVAPERLGAVATSAAYRPAAGPAAGGDFYDLFALEDGKLAVIVGDVSGHGREALPHTALVRFTLRAYLEAGLSPRVAMQTAGAVLERQLGSSFATVIAATYDPRERRLVFSCAGHPPPIVLGSEELAPVTVSSAPPVGVGMRTGTRQSIVSVPGGATICFHTDGVTEARVGGGELYGSDRLSQALAQLDRGANAADLLDLVTRQTDRRPDDMAACLLHVEGDGEPPRILAEELELDREELSSGRTERFLLACGMEPYEVEQALRSALRATEGSSKVILGLHHGAGRPEVSIQHDNLAYIQPRRAARRADLEVSL